MEDKTITFYDEVKLQSGVLKVTIDSDAAKYIDLQPGDQVKIILCKK